MLFHTFNINYCKLSLTNEQLATIMHVDIQLLNFCSPRSSDDRIRLIFWLSCLSFLYKLVQKFAVCVCVDICLDVNQYTQSLVILQAQTY